MHWDPMISSIKNKSIIVTYNVLSTITLLLTLPFRKSQLLFTEYCDFLSYEKPWCFQFQGFDSVPIQMIEEKYFSWLEERVQISVRWGFWSSYTMRYWLRCRDCFIKHSRCMASLGSCYPCAGDCHCLSVLALSYKTLCT